MQFKSGGSIASEYRDSVARQTARERYKATTKYRNK